MLECARRAVVQRSDLPADGRLNVAVRIGQCVIVRITGEAVEPFEVAPRRVSGPLNLGTLVVRRPAIRGIVLDAAGLPRSGYRVKGVPVPPVPGRVPVISSLVADDGRFRLVGVLPETVYVLELIGRFGVEATGVEAVAGSREEVVLRAQPVGDLAVRVRDGATDRPLKEFMISLWPDASQEWFGSISAAQSIPDSIVGRSQAVSLRDAAAHVIRGIRSGRWRLRVGARGYATTVSEPVEIAADSLTEADVALDPGRELRGRVRTANDAGVAGASITVTSPGSGVAGPDAPLESLGHVRLTTVSDAAGAFRVEGVSAATHVVRAAHPRYRPADTTIDCQLSESCSVELTLTPRAEVRGVAVGPDGAPVPHAKISLSTPGARERVETAEADDRGAFAFEAVLPGPARLIGRGPKGEFGSVPVQVGEDGDKVVLVLRRGATVKGQVESRSAQASVTRHVHCECADGFVASTTLDEALRFEIENVPAGILTCRFTTEGMRGARVWSKRQSVGPEGGEIQWLVTLEPGFAVDGIVRGSKSPGSCRVLASAARGVVAAQTAVDADGRFRLAELDPGTWTVTTQCGSLIARRSIQLVDRDVEIEVALPQQSVSGRVLSADSASPLTGVLVQATIGGETMMRTITDSGGHFSLSGLEDGEATVVASSAGFRPGRARIRLPYEGDGLALVLERAQDCAVSLLDARSGAASRSFKYRLFDDAGVEIIAGEDGASGDGRLALPCVARGSLLIGGPAYATGHYRVSTEGQPTTLRLSGGGSIVVTRAEKNVSQRTITFTTIEGLPLFDSVFGKREWAVALDGLQLRAAVGAYTMSVDGLAVKQFRVGEGQTVQLELP